MNPPMFRRILVSLLSLTLVVACESTQAEETNILNKQIPSGDSYGQLSDQGKLRTYYMYTPKSYHSDSPMPLVLVFHGDDGSGRSIADVTRFNDLAEQKGFIVVYPDGLNHRWSIRGTHTKVSDVSFVSALINHLEQVRNIDKNKIYATGFSRGAILTQALACQLPDKIAAFGSVAGALPTRIKPSCQPQNPISMFMINGTNDQDVHYEGDDLDQKGALASVPETVNFWKAHDQCKALTPVQQKANSDDSSDRFKVKTAQFSGCVGGAEVVQLSVVDGGHFWPGGTTQDPQLKQVNNQLGFSATQAMWDFFQRHSLSSSVDVTVKP
jgi:polyhydroxybutyrate depolymerase